MQNKRRKSFLGDVARSASHDVGARNVIQNFLTISGDVASAASYDSNDWREKFDWNFEQPKQMLRVRLVPIIAQDKLLKVFDQILRS